MNVKKYRIFQERPSQGFASGSGHVIRESRIKAFQDGDTVPEDAIAVADDEPETAWTHWTEALN